MNKLYWYFDVDINNYFYVGVINDSYDLYYNSGMISKDEMKIIMKIINEFKYALLYFKVDKYKELCKIKIDYYKNERIPLRINYTLAELEELIYEYTN